MRSRHHCAPLTALVLPLGLTPLVAQRDADRKQWIQPFNGRNLDGWVPKITGYPLGENHADTFRVENGVLVRQVHALRRQVRAPVLQQERVLLTHPRGGVPLRW